MTIASFPAGFCVKPLASLVPLAIRNCYSVSWTRPATAMHTNSGAGDGTTRPTVPDPRVEVAAAYE